MCAEALSINDRLRQSIGEMQRLHALERKKKNEEQQIKNDAKYQDLVHQTALLCRAVHYAQERFHFSCPFQRPLIDLLNDLELAAAKGAVEEDSVSGAARKLRSIQDQIKREWAKHYPTVTASAANTLKIIRRIDPEHVDPCLLDLESAKVWQNTGDDLLRLQALSFALQRSNEIISRLNLDQEVVRFLTNVSLNRATLNDLTDGILRWIRAENLSDRIRISF